MTLTERFISKIKLTDSGCWEWTAYRDKDGYGLYVMARGQTKRAHRYAYEAEYGPIPKGQPLDHLCRNRACVRPSHLELVTQKVNIERGSRAQQTHCIHGHEFTPENTYIKHNGARQCKACHMATEKRPEARARRAAASKRYRDRQKI